ncbi:MAG TPA: GNAT family N-acetyltransferase [Methanobacterium sp.]|nr:GNAT family N-acetyltransferase [Methanobacterium sp.]
MDISDEIIASLIEYNTAKYFLNLGLLNDDEICDTPEIKYIFTKNWQSRVFMANFKESNASSSIMKVVSRIKELNIHVLWFVSPMSRPENLQNILKDHGFSYRNEWKAMAIDLKTVPESFDIQEGMEIKEVLNLNELKIWTDILVKSFEFPEIVISYKKYFIKAGLKDLNSHYYLGFLNGKPVATGVLFNGEGAAGLFYIGTIPKARKQGIAQTMVYYLLNKAKNRGYGISVLQASEMGYPVYKKIGFKKYYTTEIYNR